MKLNEMTKESLQKLEKAMVGETVEVEGRMIKVKRYKEGDCSDCIGGRMCGTGACTSNVRTDNTSVYFSDVTAESKPDPIEYLTTREAAHRLGVTVKKVREMARAGVIPAHKTGALIGYSRGRDWVFDSKDVEDYMNGTKRLDGIMVGGTICKPADVTDLAARLLPFEGVDEHMIFPIAKYHVQELGHDGLFGAVGYSAVGSGVLCSGDYGNRAQAVEACRADLRIRLKAVDELKGGCK